MRGERLLVADDEPDVLDVARFALEMAGFDVQPVSNGVEAIEAARREQFSLFLTDVKMPGMDGLEAFQRIRAFDANILGVAMTGYGTMSIAIQALKHGFTDFLIKPFSPDDLIDAVNRSLEKERLRRENVRLKALIPLFELSHIFMMETHLPTLLERVVQTAQAETRTLSATLLLKEQREFEVAAHAGERFLYNQRWAKLATWVLRSKQPMVIEERAHSHPAYDQGAERQGTVLALPLFTKKSPLGCLTLTKALGEPPFTEGDAELMSVLASQVAVAIENARLFQERETAYRELEQMDHMKSEFINIAAHELRTPLSLVLGYAGMLEEETEGALREYVRSISHNAMRLRTIVEDMTNLRHLETDQSQLDLVAVDFHHLVQRVLDVVEPPLESQPLHVHRELDDLHGLIQVDARKMELVLGNLIANAYKYSSPEGNVWVRLEGDEEEIHFSVQDEGPGIPEIEHTKIWQRFYQVEASLTRVHGGMGLGLAIVRGMVELHGGRVWVESTVGQGSTFHFALPRRESE